MTVAQTRNATPLKTALSAPEWEARGNEWNPDLHYTGVGSAKAEIELLWSLAGKYDRHIVAYATNVTPGVTALPGMYSVELQFGDTPEAREASYEFEAEFEKAHRALKKKAKAK